MIMYLAEMAVFNWVHYLNGKDGRNISEGLRRVLDRRLFCLALKVAFSAGAAFWVYRHVRGTRSREDGEDGSTTRRYLDSHVISS